MRSSIFRISIGILSFALIVSVAGWLFLSHSQETKSPQPIIPNGWKRLELDDFSFYIPPDLEDQKARGIDSAVWEFRNHAMSLSIDYGMYSNDLEFYKDQPDYHAEWLRIDGKKAKVATLRMSDKYPADS